MQAIKISPTRPGTDRARLSCRVSLHWRCAMRYHDRTIGPFTVSGTTLELAAMAMHLLALVGGVVAALAYGPSIW